MQTWELHNLGTWELGNLGFWELGNSQPLRKKILCNLSGQKKIMQPVRTKKNHTTYREKNHKNLFGIKITQPLGTEKNHLTYWDKKKSPNLLGEKITQPLGTKKKSPNLSGKK